MADWSSLPSELVRVIADKLVAIEDYTALAAVCRSFRSAAERDKWRPDDASRPPWLLLCCPDDDTGGGDDRALLSMYKDKKKFYMDLPEINGRRCFGTPYGWIITLGHDRQLHLFNPLNRRRIALPELTCDREFDDDDEAKGWIRRRLREKAVLIKRPPNSYSSSPVYDDFLVVTVTGLGYVTVMRPRTNTLDTLCRPSGTPEGYIFDIVSYNGQIYAVGVAGRLLIISNSDGPDPPVVAEEYVPPNPSQINGTAKLYLVESRGELLLVVRDIVTNQQIGVELHYSTEWFDVYKLNHQTKKWVEVEDLEDRALFVGDCQSVVLASAESYNCRNNCIYFADDNYEHFRGKRLGHDMGIFDFTEGTIERFYEGADSLSFYSNPTWFIPSFA